MFSTGKVDEEKRFCMYQGCIYTTSAGEHLCCKDTESGAAISTRPFRDLALPVDATIHAVGVSDCSESRLSGW
jgi:hypothetical protein